MNKIKDYNDIARNLPSPTSAFLLNNTDTKSNEGNDFPPTDSFFPYSSCMSPSDNITQVPILTLSRTRYSNSTAELQNVQENTNDEVRLDKDLKNLFQKLMKLLNKLNKKTMNSIDSEVVKKKMIKVKYQNN